MIAGARDRPPVAGIFENTTFEDLYQQETELLDRPDAGYARAKRRHHPNNNLHLTLPPHVFTFTEDDEAAPLSSLSWWNDVYLENGIVDCLEAELPDRISLCVPFDSIRTPDELLASYRQERSEVSPKIMVVAPAEYAGHPLPAFDVAFDVPPSSTSQRRSHSLPKKRLFFTEMSADAKRCRLNAVKSASSDTEIDESPISISQCLSSCGQQIWAPLDPSQCRFVVCEDGFDEAPVEFDDMGDGGDDTNAFVEDDDPARKLSRCDRRRAQLWRNIVKNEMPREHRKYQVRCMSAVNHFKRVSFIAVKEVRRLALRCHRLSRDYASRARRCVRDMQAYWRKMDKELVERRKVHEKEEVERLKALEEAREAAQQQRKLEFLLTQTELFSHFIGKKMGILPTDPSQSENPEPVEIFAEADQGLAQEAAEATKLYIQQTRERSQMFDAGMANLDVNIETELGDDEEVDLLHPSTMPANSEMWSEPTLFKGKLKEYQIKGLNWLVNLYEQGINGILADEMGLGKTIQTICLLGHLAEAKNIWGPFLIVAPNSTLHQWKQELNKFFPPLTVIPYWGSLKDRTTIRKFWKPKSLSQKDSPFHVCITSYAVFVNDEKHFQRIKWQYMVLDEAQAIKNSGSQRWAKLLNLKCRNRLLLTGTPIQNSMAELWALLHFIMPTLFDSHEEFNRWFSKDVENAATGDKQALDAHKIKRLHMILQPFMLRRVKHDVEHEMSAKIEIQLSCELSRRQRTLYRALQNKISFAELGDTSLTSKENLMNLVMQFRKVCNHPEVFERSWASSPFQFTFDSYLSSGNSTSGGGRGVGATPPLDSVFPTAHNPIQCYFPKLLLDVVDTISPRISSIWAPSHIHSSSAFAFHRLIDRSPSETAFTFWSQLSPLHAWLAVIASEYLSHRFYNIDRWLDESDVDVDVFGRPIRKIPLWSNLGRLLIVKQNYRLQVSNVFGGIADDVSSSLKHKVYSLPLLRVLDDRVAAATQQLVVSSRRQYIRCLDSHSGWERSVLTGIDCRPWCKDPASSNCNDSLLLPCGVALPARYRNVVSPIVFANSSHALSLPGLCEEVFKVVGSDRSQIFAPHFGKLIADSGKLMVLDRLLSRLKAEGHRVLIFSQMKKMIDILEDYMHYRKYSMFRLDGTTELADRRDMVNEFQSNTDIFAFLLSTRAGGLGITLTAADTVIFFDNDWNPTMDAQAQDRVHRIGQTKQVTVYRMVCKGTVEERILKRAQDKFEIQKTVYSGQFKLQKANDVDLFKKSELKEFLRDSSARE
uniref:Chromatin-remodeling ATPase INO80 n=1 Tax=Spongospora subterranea TaxID=70186 RepID=A0A0H5RNC9_9EUKA|eukprot:CRZ10244.1 hypothetical protein [Spongospora subterranea]